MSPGSVVRSAWLLAVLVGLVLLLSWAFTGLPARAGVGDPADYVSCPSDYTAVIYAVGLSSPDGLAQSPDGQVYVAEETAGRVSRLGPGGTVTPVLEGLSNPEGIAFDDAGNLYVVEDVAGGRVIKMTPGGITTTLATGRDAPEGIVWSPDGTLYITESNVQFTANPLEWETGVTAISGSGDVRSVRTDAWLWSYAGITLGPGELLYVTNEASGTGTDDSIFGVDPEDGARSLLASGLTAPEGLRFSPGGGFPLYVAEEGSGGDGGRLSLVRADGSVTTLCSGFLTIEDVLLDPAGRLYVSEDGSGSIISIEPPSRISFSQTAVPASGAVVRLGSQITFTFLLSHSIGSELTGLILTDTLPPGIRYDPASFAAGPDLYLAAAPPPALIVTGTLPAGAAQRVSFRVTVTTPLSLILSNTATLSSDQTPTQESNPAVHLVRPDQLRWLFLPLLIRNLHGIAHGRDR
jgi:uncharacterized repeat protein (TIGR01451 family)